MTSAGRPPRVENMTGLAADQVDDLVAHLADCGLWQVRRRRALDPHRSVLIVLLYLRHNLSQRLLAELFGCSQPTVSRLVTVLIPVLTDLLSPLADRVAERELRSTVRRRVPRPDRRPARQHLHIRHVLRETASLRLQRPGRRLVARPPGHDR
jgi:hypothetical protein